MILSIILAFFYRALPSNAIFASNTNAFVLDGSIFNNISNVRQAFQ